MSLQDMIAIAALAAGALALPAAWAQAHHIRTKNGKDIFRKHLTMLQQNPQTLVQRVIDRSPIHWQADDLPVYTRPGWISEAPFDLSEIDVRMIVGRSDIGEPAASRSLAGKVLAPLRLGSIDRYSTALTQIAGMHRLFDGKIYRLIQVELGPNVKRLLFTESSYFNYLDTSEILAFETARGRVGRSWPRRRSYRHRLADPFDFTNRTASLGVNTLTIRSRGDQAGFFLLHRDSTKVVNDADSVGLIPAGEFAPSDISHEAVENDLDIWKNIMREYAEEILGVEDAQGQGGRWIDYAAESPYRELHEARRNGRLRVSVLGLVIDPLPWKPELLTVCVIDAEVFDRIFPEVPRHNNEGRILSGNGRDGLPFDAATIERYTRRGHSSANTRALLTLSWRFRHELGLAPRPESVD